MILEAVFKEEEAVKADFGVVHHVNKVDASFVANALKGTASGSAVAMTDVSPLEHNIGVKLASDTVTDFSSVTLTKYGRNLFNTNWTMINSKVLDATTGLPKDWAASWCITDFLPIEENGFSVGQTYTASRNIGVESYPICLYDKDKNFISSHQARYHYTNETAVFTIPENCKYIRLSIIVANMNDAMVVLGNYPTIPQLNESCPFEVYKNAEVYSANEDGSVQGIIGNGESMTLATGTEGVTITAEYNRDLNKAFESLVNAIISLGGNV
jgi:hypothetical protein